MARITKGLLLVPMMAGLACGKAPVPTANQPVNVAPSVNWSDRPGAVYDLNLTSEAVVAPGAAPVKLKIAGQLELQSSNAAAPTTQLRAHLSNLEVQGGSGQGAADTPQLVKELGSPWGFELQQGRLQRLHVSGATSRFGASIMTIIAAALQYRAPADTGSTWTSEEMDASGTYRASYTLGATPGDVNKVKLDYNKVDLRSVTALSVPLDLTPHIVASSGELHIDKGHITHVRSHEELQVLLTARSPLTSKTDIELTERNVGQRSDAVGWEQMLSTTVALAPGQAVLSNRRDQELESVRIGDYTFDSALEELKKEKLSTQAPSGQSPAAVSEEEKVQQHSKVFTAITAIMRRDPTALVRAVKLIEQNSPVSRSLLDALGSTDSPQAQTALCDLAQSKKLAEARRREAAFALIRTPNPTSQSVEMLIRNLDDTVLRQYAIYGLGTFARRLRESGQVALSNQASLAVLAQLPNTKESQRVDVLRGIANSAYVPALVQVRPLLEDADASIRVAAVDAIRLMASPEVDGLIAARAVATEKPSVRQTALDAAARREPTDVLVAAVSEAAQKAPDSQSRSRAVRLMENWLPQHPELASVLRQIAWSDPREGIRKLAKASLPDSK